MVFPADTGRSGFVRQTLDNLSRENSSDRPWKVGGAALEDQRPGSKVPVLLVLCPACLPSGLLTTQGKLYRGGPQLRAWLLAYFRF